MDDVTDDYNRVVLDLQDGIPDSDYINASYIDVSPITWNTKSQSLIR